MPSENTNPGERPDLGVVSTDANPQAGMDHADRTDASSCRLSRVGAALMDVAPVLGELLIRLLFFTAPAGAVTLGSLLPVQGYSGAGVPGPLAMWLADISGVVFAFSLLAWIVLTAIWLFSAHKRRGFEWYALLVSMPVVGMFACAAAPTIVSVLGTAAPITGLLGLEVQ